MKNLACMAILVASGFVLSGCEILSLSSYPENTLVLNPEFPTGKFATLDQDFVTFSKEDGRIGAIQHGMSDPEEMGYLNIFKLKNFNGFTFDPVPLDSKLRDSVNALNPEIPKQLKSQIEASESLHMFGMYEVHDDALLLTIPYYETAVLGYIREMGFGSFEIETNGFSQSRVLAISPEELVEFMDRVVKENMVLPMILVPVEFAQDWGKNASEEDARAFVRSRYPKLMDRYEEIERAIEP